MFSGHVFYRRLRRERPRHEFVDLRVGMAIDEFVSVSAMQVCGSTPLSLQVSISDATVAQFSPPPSEPAKSAFFSIQRDRPDGSLDDVGVNLDPAIVNEPREALPA